MRQIYSKNQAQCLIEKAPPSLQKSWHNWFVIGLAAGLIIAATYLIKGDLLVATVGVNTSCQAEWCGQVKIGSNWFQGKLYKIDSNLGYKPSGIDKTLALMIESPQSNGTFIVEIAGGRNDKPSSSFAGSPSFVMFDNQRILDAGANIVFAEYRGSINPGGPNIITPPPSGDASIFNPPLPKYGDLIPNYDTYDGLEWGHGEVDDVVSIVNFVKTGGMGQATKVIVIGGSHGGNLALEAAYQISGITKTVVLHGVPDFKLAISYLRNPPQNTYLGRTTESPWTILDSISAWETEMAEGRIWPNNLEALLQRLFRHGGGETEMLNNKPNCRFFTFAPASENILLISDVDDSYAPAASSRTYFRELSQSYPNIKLLEHGSLEEVGWKPEVFHGNTPEEALAIEQYLVYGTVPPEFSGPLSANVKVKVIDDITEQPIQGATIEISEIGGGCGQTHRANATTNVNGIAEVQTFAGFVTSKVAKDGYQDIASNFYLVRGVTNWSNLPIRLTQP